MPYVHHGIGTWYWGKRNSMLRRGTCESCGSSTTLHSYDTTLFVVVLFIPIIPLGTKRISNDCANCRKHRVSSLSKWEKAKTEAINATGRAFAANPTDPKVAIEAISAAASFDARTEFIGLTAIFDPVLEKDAGFLRALAEASEWFGVPTEARRAYEALQQLNPQPDPKISRALGVLILKHGEPEEALLHLLPILEAGNANELGLLFLTVEGLQAAGEHWRALELLDDSANRIEGLTQNKEFKRYHKLSEKNQDTGKRIASKTLAANTVKANESSWRFGFAKFVPIVVALLAFVIYISVAFVKGQWREVWIVSGLSEPCNVGIGGRSMSLLPLTPVPVSLPEGDITIRYNTPAGMVADQTVSIRTSFWGRPFDDSTFVINPDQLAFISVESVNYSVKPQNSGGLYTAVAAKSLHTFKGIEYPFAPFPASISVKKYSSKSRRRLGVEISTEPRERVAEWLRQLGRNGTFELCKLGVQRDPSVRAYFDGLRVGETLDEALAVLGPLLDRRPLAIEAHRAFQDISDLLHKTTDLDKRYEDLLKANPTSGDAMYLLARITADPAKAIALHTAAIAATPPQPLSRRAIAATQLERGDFALAMQTALDAIKAGDTEENLSAIVRNSLQGLGRLDECLIRPEFAQPIGTAGFDIDTERIWMLVAMKKTDAARAAVDQIAARSSPEHQNDTHAYLSSMIAHASGDMAESILAARRANIPSCKFQAAIMDGQLETALALITPAPGSGGSDWGPSAHLTLALAAALAGKTDLRDQHAELAGAMLADQSRYTRHAGTTLKATGVVPTVDDAARMSIESTDKAMLFALMGLRNPAARDECFRLAKLFNFDRRFPYQLVKQAIERP